VIFELMVTASFRQTCELSAAAVTVASWYTVTDTAAEFGSAQKALLSFSRIL
jgi:hypothetical protein